MSQTVMFRECDLKGGSQDLFTPEFKRLKARYPLPDLSGITDLSKQRSLCNFSPDESICEFPVRSLGLKPVAGVKPCEEWKCYQFSNYPGLLVIQNPFVDGYQRYWVSRCLQDFPSDRENVTNLTALGEDSGGDLWHEFVQKKSLTFDKLDPLRKLRWTTLGYHYNWTTKEYSEENKAPFPEDVNCLSQYFAACLGFAPYQAEAAIVNYYHLDSTLAGHTDHSEMDQTAPLFSISFGQTAVFLLGGHTKSVRPMSVFLRSGDVCVMSGECRLAYHAVPKILAPPSEEPIPSSLKSTHIPQLGTCDSTTISSGAGRVMNACRPTFTSPDISGDILSDPHSINVSLESEDSREGHCDLTEAGKDFTGCQITGEDNDRMVGTVQYFQNYNSNIDTVNSKIEEVTTALDFTPFQVFLESSRINLNVRQVLPPGWTNLRCKHQ